MERDGKKDSIKQSAVKSNGKAKEHDAEVGDAGPGERQSFPVVLNLPPQRPVPQVMKGGREKSETAIDAEAQRKQPPLKLKLTLPSLASSASPSPPTVSLKLKTPKAFKVNNAGDSVKETAEAAKSESVSTPKAPSPTTPPPHATPTTPSVNQIPFAASVPSVNHKPAVSALTSSAKPTISIVSSQSHSILESPFKRFSSSRSFASPIGSMLKVGGK